MAINRDREGFDGGLVNSRDPSLLAPGEMAKCTNAHYRPNSTALWPVQAKEDIASSDITQGWDSLQYLGFQGVLDRILIGADSDWFLYNVTGGGKDEIFTGRSNGLKLRAIHYANQYIVGNGNDPQWLATTAYGSADAAQNPPQGWFPLGLSALSAGGVTALSFINSADADYVSAWDQTNYPGNASAALFTRSTFNYWVTELISSLGMEAPATSLAWPGLGDNTTFNAFEVTSTNIKLVFQEKKNTKATHRRIYRALVPTTQGEQFQKGFSVKPPITLANRTGTDGDFPLVGELLDTIPITGAGSASSYSDIGTTSNIPYGSITANVLGVTTTISRDSSPPTFGIGDVFEDSLVVNDAANEHIFRYSFPGKPWSFPGIYFIDIATEQRSTLTCIKRLGDILIVGLKNGMYRVNYLPRETDADFARGRAYEQFSDVGCISKRGYTLFSPESHGPRLAWVARDNVWTTDGYNLIEATRDVDWENTVDVDALDDAVLVNVPHLWLMILYYQPKGGSKVDQALYFHYHPQHMKEGRMKVTGPVTQIGRMDGTPDIDVRLTDAVYGNDRAYNTITYATDLIGRLLREDFTSTANGDAIVQSRMAYPSGLDEEVEIKRLYLLSKAPNTQPTSPTYAVNWRSRFADSGATASGIAESFTSAQLDRKDMGFFGEAWQLLVTSSGPLEYFEVKYDITETK